MAADPPGPVSPRRLLLGVALAGFACAVALASHAAAVDEAEPNDIPSQATGALLNETAAGQVQSSNDDYWRLDFTSAALLTVDISTSSGSAYLDFKDAGGATVPSALEDMGSLHDVYRLVVAGAGAIYVEVTTNNPDTAYTLSFATDEDLSPIEGASEVEPNNDRPLATPFLVDVLASGTAPVEHADVDWWSTSVPSAGYLWVQVGQGLEMSFEVFAGAQQLEDETGALAAYHVFVVAAAGTIHFSVMADFGSGDYDLVVAFAQESSTFWEGRDEVEVNNAPAGANEVEVGQPFRGVLDVEFDETDYFVVKGSPGTLVTVNLTVDSDPLGFALVWINGSANYGDWSNDGDIWYYEVQRVFAGGGQFVFNLSASWADQTYSINVTSQALALFDDGVVTLSELLSAVALEAELIPNLDLVSDWERSYDLANGNGFMFGFTMCVQVVPLGDIPDVRVTAGTRLVGEDDEVQVLVVSRTESFTVPSGERGCFRAMSESEEGTIAGPYSPYHIQGVLDGDAARVMAQINESRRDGAEGQLALWAVTSGTTEARARQWSASPSTIDGARSILNTAGVRTSLSPNAGQTNSGGGGGGTGGGVDMGLVAGVIVLVLLLVAVAVAVAVRAGRKKAAAGGTPPLAQAPGSYGQGAYGPSAPGSGPSGAATYGASQQGQGYAAYGATGYVSPAPDPYAQPYGSQPSYGYAPQPPAPAQPAGTAPCPGCGAPVAYYAPSCGSCGHPLNWS